MALRDVISKLKEQKERREMRGRYILGTLSAIEYDDSCKVTGRPNYMWVREYNNPNNAFQAFAPATQDRPGLPVYVTKNVQPPHYRVQVVDIDYGRMDDDEDISNSYEAHAPAHEWPDGAPGADVVTVYSRAIYPLCVRRYSGMVVYITPGIYMYNDEAIKYTGEMYDMSAHLPTAGNALRVCLYIDPGTNTVAALESDEVVSTVDPEYPLPAVGNLPVGWVKLLSTTTTIVESLIADPRPFVAVSDYNPDNYYTKTELNTPNAGGEVHWDNITDKPPMEVTLFLHEEDADIAGYERLLEHPSDDPENIDSAVLVEVDTEYVIDEYITYPATGWGRTFIQGGAWQFMTWVRVDSAVGDTRLVIRVYKRDQGGNETELFNVTSAEINNTAVGEIDLETVQPDIFLDETDRLVVKYLGKTTSVADRTIYLYYEGSVNYSHIHLPGAGISGDGGAVDFVDLADVPNSYTGAGGYAVKVLATEDGLEFVAETIPEAFTDLSDTPADYTDQAGKVVKVNATEDGLEFGDVIDGTAIHTDQAGEIEAITEKTDPVSTDLLLIEDSWHLNVKKSVKVGNLLGPLNTAVCQGRLTLESGVAVSTADQAGKATLYWTPFRGNRISLYAGDGVWDVLTFSEISSSLAGKTANLPYDVFAYNNVGDVTLSLVAWTNISTRAVALTLQDGVLVHSGNAALRYLGTIYINSTGGQTDDTITKRNVWNYYNRVIRRLFVSEATSHTYSGVVRLWNNSETNNRLEVLIGVVEDAVTFFHRFYGKAGASGQNCITRIYVDGGWNGISIINNTDQYIYLGVTDIPILAAGFHYFNVYELSSHASTTFGAMTMSTALLG